MILFLLLTAPCERPPQDADWIYGAGLGLEAARLDAAATLEVTVQQKTYDRATLWQGQETQELRMTTQQHIDTRLRGCETVQTCGDRVVIKCARKSELEREATKLAAKLAARWPANASVAVLPATDADGYITALGELASAMVRDALGPRVKRLPPWEPAKLDALARAHALTHVIRGEHRPASARHRFTFWLTDIAGNVSEVFTFDAAESADLVERRGPLFPMKDAFDLAALRSVGGEAKLRVPSRINSGDSVTIDIQVPEDSYVYLFNIFEDGVIAPLLTAHQLRANHPYKFTARARAIPSQPITRERLKLVAAPIPIDLAHTTSTELIAKLNTLKSKSIPFLTATATYEIVGTGTTFPSQIRTPKL